MMDAYSVPKGITRGNFSALLMKSLTRTQKILGIYFLMNDSISFELANFEMLYLASCYRLYTACRVRLPIKTIFM